MRIKKPVFEQYLFTLALVDIIGFGYWPDSSSDNSTSKFISQILTAISLLAMSIIVLINSQNFWVRVRKAREAGRVLLCALLGSLIALVFTEYPIDTILIVFRITVIYCVALSISDRRVVFLSLLSVSWFFLWSTLLSALVFPEIAFEQSVRIGSLKGLLVYKTQFGLASVLFLSLMIYKFKSTERSRSDSVVGLVFLIFILFSQSLVSIVSVLLIAFIALGKKFYDRVEYAQKSALIFVGAIAILFVMIFGVGVFIWISEVFGRTDSIATRLTIWREVLGGFDHSVFVGYGLNAFLKDLELLDSIQNMVWFFRIETVHNAYIEWFVGAGLFGLISFVLGALGGAMKLFVRRKAHILDKVLSINCMVLTISAMLTSSVAFSSLSWFLIFYTMVVYESRTSEI